MIFLSRIILNPRDREVRRDLADCQDLHRTIMSAFPRLASHGGNSRDTYAVLYRLEPSPRAGGPPIVVVQSETAPDWTKLPSTYVLETTGDPPNPGVKRVDDLYAALGEGTRLRFRLQANPTRKIDTKSRPNGEHRNGRRVPLSGDEERLAWLQRKSEASGFRILAARSNSNVPDVRTGAGGKITGSRENALADGKATKLTFGAVLFDGNLMVTDADRFREALRRGIGPAKAYGFGLLSVAPARE